MADDSFTERLKARDADAWSAFYRDHVRELWRYVYRQCGNDAATADDITSEAFMAAVEGIAGYDPAAGEPVRWLFGIARRKVADHLRRRYRAPRFVPVCDDLPAAPPPPAPPDPPGSPDQPDPTGACIDAAMASMPRPQREVLLWMYRDGLSVRRIAQRINRSDKAVENLLYRARRRFKAVYLQHRTAETAS